MNYNDDFSYELMIDWQIEEALMKKQWTIDNEERLNVLIWWQKQNE